MFCGLALFWTAVNGRSMLARSTDESLQCFFLSSVLEQRHALASHGSAPSRKWSFTLASRSAMALELASVCIAIHCSVELSIASDWPLVDSAPPHSLPQPLPPAEMTRILA
ncbi:unnamed protein product [Prorocentrum cordatum]|uniref:Secreted protein n=1 Tax=Prorocentrum cordatum TaxID=2364126 RepID=A0ABN9U164_9DINO|nr:unnamed protein product [Polarella glacialis]